MVQRQQSEGAVSSISSTLYQGALRWLFLALEPNAQEIVGTGSVPNTACIDGLATYVAAVTVWEAFLYENLLAAFPRSRYPDSALWKVPAAEVDRWNILTKTAVVPDMLFGQTFDTGSQPFQDLKLLVKIRNELTHFKMSPDVPRPVQDLLQRKVLRIDPGYAEHPGAHPWTWSLQCTGGMRWALATVRAAIRGLVRLAGDDGEPMLAHMVDNFPPLSDRDLAGWFVAEEAAGE